jgi:response regulator RpfG family c-di-GMP phosphodiesterase
MSERVLFVDDEQNVLDGIRRQLRKQFDVHTACGAEEGLRAVQESGPFAVIVSDMKMPNMNGAEFLARARSSFPDGVRMILSGQSELSSAISAVNDGNIFRFLTKPCPPEVLTKAVEAGLEQFRLVTAERQLLEETLSGAVKVLAEVLGLLSPRAFSRSSRIQQYADHVSNALHIPNRWQLRMAATLSEIGCISLPSETLQKLEAGQPLSAEETKMVRNHPTFASELLGKIPRLEVVARIVAKQREKIDTTGLPPNVGDWDLETLGVHVLGMCRRFDELLEEKIPPSHAIEQLRNLGFASALVDTLATAPLQQGARVAQSIKVSEMRVAMLLDQDVKTVTGLLLVPKGQEITRTVLVRLRNFAEGIGVEEPCRVLVSA